MHTQVVRCKEENSQFKGQPTPDPFAEPFYSSSNSVILLGFESQ